MMLFFTTFSFQLISFLNPPNKKLYEFIFLLTVMWCIFNYFSALLLTIQTIRSILTPIWDALIPLTLTVANLFMFLLFPLAPLSAVIYSLFSLQVLEALLFPLFSLTFLVIFLNRIDSTASLTRLGELLRGVLVFLLFIFFSAFTFFLTVSGGLSWIALDQLKPSLVGVLQNSIPIVGSLFTEGLSTVKGIASLSALTGGTALGIFLISSAIIPLVKLLLDAFVFRLTGAVISALGSDRVGGLLDDLGKLLFIVSAWFLFLIAVLFLLAVYLFILFQFAMGG